MKAGTTTREIASKWPSAKEAYGYEEEDQAAANLWGHGLGLAQYDPPVISRIWSLDHPIEIKPGMVFALETQHGKMFRWGVRIEEMLIVHEDRIEIISNFPVEQITVVDPMPGYGDHVRVIRSRLWRSVRQFRVDADEPGRHRADSTAFRCSERTRRPTQRDSARKPRTLRRSGARVCRLPSGILPRCGGLPASGGSRWASTTWRGGVFGSDDPPRRGGRR